jgi:GNAT superfamily N-acetyltransferase
MATERRRAAPPDSVEVLAKRHVPQAARVIATALADDPGYRHLMPIEARRVGELVALYRMTLDDTITHGRGYVTTLGTIVTGALAIYPPGTYPMPLHRWARVGGRVALLAVHAREHSRGLIRFGHLTAPAVPTHAWYIEAAGVRPDLQRAGRGTALIEAALAMVDEAGDESYLETTKPANVDYYERFGFTPIREPVPLAADGPSIYPMLRPARLG